MLDSQVGLRADNIIVTDRAGIIVEVTVAAALLLNVTSRGLARHPRPLALFFDGGRDAICAALRAAGPETSPRLLGMLRPRERSPRPVALTVQEAAEGYLEWTLHSK